jgi:hypothetical protein
MTFVKWYLILSNILMGLSVMVFPIMMGKERKPWDYTDGIRLFLSFILSLAATYFFFHHG